MDNQWTKAVLWILVGVLGALIGVAGTAVFLVCTDGVVEPGNFLSFDYWLKGENGTSRSEIVRNLGLALAAFIGLAIAVWRLVLADKQQTLAERGHIIDRINKAVENLGHKTTAVKLGGVHALWRLIEEISVQGEDTPYSNVKMILDILASFVRQKAKGRIITDKNGELDLRTDVATAVYLFGSRRDFYRSKTLKKYRLSFRGAVLSGVILDGCEFHRADFYAVDLSEASLKCVKFNNANMRGVVLTNADLTGAVLNGADLTDAVLKNANLTGADFTGAKGLTQRQIDEAACDQKNRPTRLGNLKPPTGTLEDYEAEVEETNRARVEKEKNRKSKNRTAGI